MNRKENKVIKTSIGDQWNFPMFLLSVSYSPVNISVVEEECDTFDLPVAEVPQAKQDSQGDYISTEPT